MNFNPNQNWNFQQSNNGFSRIPYRQYNQREKRIPIARSGASAGTTKTGKPYVRGWKATKMGVVTIIAGPYEAKNSSTQQHQSKTGRLWENWAAKVSAPFQAPVIVGALYDTTTGKVRIPSMGIVISPRGANGGYMGKPMSKNMRRY